MKIPALAKRRLERGTHQERLGAAVRPALRGVIQSSLVSHMGFPHGNF
jgi:hypothetical protein